MKCERCCADTHVEPHRTGGYRGYLCESCREAWERLTDPATRPALR